MKVEALDAEFKKHYYAVIDLAGDDDHELDKEQSVVMITNTRWQKLQNVH